MLVLLKLKVVLKDYGIPYMIGLGQNLEGTILQALKMQMNFLKHIFQNLIKSFLLNLKVRNRHLWNYPNMLI